VKHERREVVVRDQAEIARLMKVTRAWVTRIMSLLHLAPDIQEAILFLTATKDGSGRTMRQLQPLAGEAGCAPVPPKALPRPSSRAKRPDLSDISPRGRES
jgi:hypothetical protein